MTAGAPSTLVRFVKFGLVGGSGVVVNLGIYVLLTRCLGLTDSLWGKNLSYAFSVEVSIITNFLLNDLWTFADRRRANGWFQRFFTFHIISLVGMAINWGIFASLNWAMHHYGFDIFGDLSVLGWQGNIDDLVAACLGIIGAMAWNFFANLWWTWKVTDRPPA